MNYANSSVNFRKRSRRSRGLRRRALASVALVALIATVLLVVHARSAPRPLAAGREGHDARIPSAERSVRTGPPISWSNGARERLLEDLQTAFAPATAGASGWSLAVVGADGRTIFDDRGGRAVAPASVQKLIVAATALDALGATYRYHTLFAGRDSVANDGVLDGDLWLIGSGDPSLQSGDLRNGVGELARSGLRRIDGRVVVDATALRGPGINPHWGTDDEGQDYAAPTSAISLDGDTIETRQEVDGVKQSFWTPMQQVAPYVASRVAGMLNAAGIATSQRPALGAAPLESVVLWDHRSAPLQTLEDHMLFVSDNHYAEQLLRTVGAEVAGAPDDAGGIDAERRFLERLGIPTPGLTLFDGSGLSAGNRIAAITLVRLLFDEEPSLYLLLPLGGRQGTLEDYDFTTALGRVRAKSGHLSDVSSLAGYVTTPRHGRLAFAFLINGSPGDPDAAIVRAVDRLATF